jgi:hypothetical protein
MAAIKLNLLHLHVTDDQAFRLEVDAAPEMARRSCKPGESYSRRELAGLVKEGKQVGITVMVELVRSLNFYALALHFVRLPLSVWCWSHLSKVFLFFALFALTQVPQIDHASIRVHTRGARAHTQPRHTHTPRTTPHTDAHTHRMHTHTTHIMHITHTMTYTHG